MNKEQIEEDLDILEMVQDLTNKLNCMHNVSTRCSWGMGR